MSIEFQNGFLCGMATKGLTRSGEYYKPDIWNDEGVYTHFYIDFRREVAPFSTGMWNESVVVHDSVQIKATDVVDLTGGIYKIVCDVSNRPHGITAMNKKTSRLRFASGEAVPVFSVHMFIAGIVPYIDAGYGYDKASFETPSGAVSESDTLVLWEYLAEFGGADSANFLSELLITSVAETPTITLT